MFIAIWIITSCASIGVPQEGWTTFNGQVIASPTCPDQINASECKPQPVESALLIVLDSEEREVTKVNSDEKGEFSVQLQPGSYYLVPMPVSGLMGTPDKLKIVVDKRTSAPVTIKYDTGIRSVTPPSLSN